MLIELNEKELLEKQQEFLENKIPEIIEIISQCTLNRKPIFVYENEVKILMRRKGFINSKE